AQLLGELRRVMTRDVLAAGCRGARAAERERHPCGQREPVAAPEPRAGGWAEHRRDARVERVRGRERRAGVAQVRHLHEQPRIGRAGDLAGFERPGIARRLASELEPAADAAYDRPPERDRAGPDLDQARERVATPDVRELVEQRRLEE